MFTTAAQRYSTKSEPRLCAYSKHVCGMSEICYGGRISYPDYGPHFDIVTLLSLCAR